MLILDMVFLPSLDAAVLLRFVIPGLVPGICVDARIKSGHDEKKRGADYLIPG
jgi:hypothetical protein